MEIGLFIVSMISLAIISITMFLLYKNKQGVLFMTVDVGQDFKAYHVYNYSGDQVLGRTLYFYFDLENKYLLLRHEQEDVILKIKEDYTSDFVYRLRKQFIRTESIDLFQKHFNDCLKADSPYNRFFNNLLLQKYFNK